MRNPEAFERQAKAHIAESLPHARHKEREKLLTDWLAKERVAPGIVADFTRRVRDPKGLSLLDVGFGNGITLATFSRAGARMSGLEVSPALHTIARAYLTEHEVAGEVALYDGETFPYANETFDAAYSVSVFEHITNPAAVMKEVYRVLKPGGLFYVAFPNRYTLKETHTGIYFISLLPRPLARWVLSAFGRNTLDDWNLHFLSYFWLRRLLRTTPVPFRIRFETTSGSYAKRALKRILAGLGIHHSALLPHVMVVLEKPL